MITGVPYDAEIEYLESTGTQWIDTGVAGVAGLNIAMQFLPIYPVATSYQDYMGGSNGDNLNGYRVRNNASTENSIGTAVGGKNVQSISIPANTTVSVSITSSAVVVNGSTVLSQLGTTYPGQTLYLFAFNRNGSAYRCSKMRLISFAVVGYVDFIPVRIGTEGALYDRVTRKVFRNSGTGSFVLGPDVARPVLGVHRMKPLIYTAQDYVQSGLLAMWDGIENAGWGAHDANATVWKDLVGTMPDLTVHDAEFSDKALHRGTSKVGYMAENETAGYFWAGRYDEFTVESCAVLVSNSWLLPLAFAVNYGGYEAIRIGYKARLDSTEYGVGVRAKGINNLVYTPLWTDMVSGTVSIVDNVGAYYNSVQMTLNPNLSFPLGNITSGIALGNNSIYNVYGDIYCTRIYSRALTASEILQNYLIDKSRFNIGGAS